MDNNIVDKPILGIHTDNHPSEQPEGTIRFAMNAIKESSEGDFNNYINEPGNTECLSLPEGFSSIGAIYLEKGDKIVFTTDDQISNIYLLTSNCISTLLVSTGCLGFKKTATVTGEYRVRKGCDRFIYWSDGLNDDKYLNLDDLDSFKTDGEWDCNKFKFNKEIKIPEINLQSVNDTGGTLSLGAYFFQVEYLDDSLNIIYRSYISNHCFIYDESQASNYYDIDGGYNIDQYLATIGGVPTTNKSINLTIDNVDETATYVKVNVIRAITGDGVTVDAHSVNTLIPYAPTINFTYRGYNTTRGDIPLDYTSLIQKNNIYSTSNLIEQVQNRLVRANVKEDLRDYSQFQRAVNSITTEWVKDSVLSINQFEEGNSKNPIVNTSFAGDEVYAVAIVFQFSNGQESPSFHIPGRGKKEHDTVEIVYDNTNYDLKHLPEKATYEQWEVYNTALDDGTMSYFETADGVYPSTLDCNGEFIYGDLAGQKVRHHKMPCRSIVPLFEFPGIPYQNGTIFLNRLGIKFSNITYPSTDIVSHRFVYVKRDEFSKSVLDTGIITGHSVTNNEEYYFNQFDRAESSQDVINFISPKSKLKQFQNGDYFKYVGYMFNLHTVYESNVSEDEYSSTGSAEVDLYLNTYGVLPELVPISGKQYRSYNNNVFVSPKSSQTGIFSKPVNNVSFSNSINAYDLVDTYDYQTGYIYAVNKKYVPDAYGNLESLRYVHTHSSPYTLDDVQTTYEGDVFISDMSIYDLNSVGRDDFLSGGLFERDIKFRAEFRYGLFVESEINAGLIHGGTECNARYDLSQDIITFSLSKFFSESGGDYNINQPLCQEFYEYNRDFSRTTQDSTYIPLNRLYDYCNPCLTERKTRIIFSPKSFDEEISDFYLINQTDDYIDLPSHRGAITGLKYKNNKLYVHTEQTTFILQPNPQFVATDQNSAYLNTGDFLSIPPYEIMQSDLGYAGLQNKLAVNNSEGGYIWADSNTGKVFRLTDKIEELSRLGNFNFFKNNLPSQLNDFYRLHVGGDYPYLDDMAHQEGIGITITYDPRFERFLVTKKDYTPNSAVFGGVINGFVRGSDKQLFIYEPTGLFVNRQLQPVSVLDKEFFCESSFTMSFSIKNNSWISYHSYLPDVSFNDEKYFYTTKDNIIYKHLHTDVFNRINGNNNPFIIEYIIKDYNTSSMSAIHYYASFTKDGTITNDNYTNLLVYNSKQSTGKLNLVNINQNTGAYGNVTLSPTQKSIITTDKNSKISNLWDNAINNKVITKDCFLFSDQKEIDGYVDLLPLNIDFSKSAYEAGELKDKYNIVRLYYYPTDNGVKLVHKISNNLELKSIR